MATHYDLIVIGSGPGGQKGAIQAAKIGKKVALIEKDRALGGACVHRGTIPSKTLRASALRLAEFEREASRLGMPLAKGMRMAKLRSDLSQVIAAHVGIAEQHLERNRIDCIHGCARLKSAHEVEITWLDGTSKRIGAQHILIATGSRPRTPQHVEIDHDQILDSDSLLALDYLPQTLCILGGGVIASEYASIFAAVGVEVSMVDTHPRPLGFLDTDLSDEFVRKLEQHGGRFLGERRVCEVRQDDFRGVTTRTTDGTIIESEKLLVALGRVPNVEGLGLQSASIVLNERGTIRVDEYFRTSAPSVSAVGDVIGYPALASYSMEQGRRAICHVYGIDPGAGSDTIPMGIYTIPEIACVGLNERDANLRADEFGGDITVGRARFNELARGHISNGGQGMLKLISDTRGEKILGIAVAGEGATELVHVGQMALQCGGTVRTLVETVFNFPTLAEAYRVAALDVLKQVRSRGSGGDSIASLGAGQAHRSAA
ncbi:MAG: Si-specific NAD(P)(+) transhydrogenase [Nannocystaceae bacterium]